MELHQLISMWLNYIDDGSGHTEINDMPLDYVLNTVSTIVLDIRR